MSKSTPVRLVVHECGCLVDYATDPHGEYPLSVEGCSINERVTARLLAGEISDHAYLVAVKGHRGAVVR